MLGCFSALRVRFSGVIGAFDAYGVGDAAAHLWPAVSASYARNISRTPFKGVRLGRRPCFWPCFAACFRPAAQRCNSAPAGGLAALLLLLRRRAWRPAIAAAALRRACGWPSVCGHRGSSERLTPRLA